MKKWAQGDNNPKKSSTAKLNMHMPSGYSLFTNCSFDLAGKNCMEKFCKNLKEHATKIINYIKKEMIPLTDRENESYERQKVCYIYKKEFSIDDNKKYQKVKDHCHYTGKYRWHAHSICNLRYKTLKEISVVFHNGSTDDYHLIIEQLVSKRTWQSAWMPRRKYKKIYYFFSTY